LNIQDLGKIPDLKKRRNGRHFGRWKKRHRERLFVREGKKRGLEGGETKDGKRF